MSFCHKCGMVTELYLLLIHAQCTDCIVGVMSWGLYWVIGKKLICYVEA